MPARGRWPGFAGGPHLALAVVASAFLAGAIVVARQPARNALPR